MTPITKTIRRLTVETYGYGKRARKLVVALEKGDLITIYERRRRTKFTARIYDVYHWMLRCQADKIHMEKLRRRKAAKAARLAAQRQRRAERRLFNGQ
jgi:predicted RNA-binding protein